MVWLLSEMPVRTLGWASRQRLCRPHLRKDCQRASPGRDNGMMMGLSCAVARRWQTSWQKVMVWLLSEMPIKTLGFRAATADLRSGWLGPSWQYGSTWSGSDSASALLRVMRPLLSTSQKRCLASTMVPPPLH